MAYAQPADVRDVLAPDGSITSGQDTAASLSDAEISRAISDASMQVDAALTTAPTAYPVPFTGTVPALVGTLARDIAAYLVTLTWRKGKPVDPQHPVVLRYQRASDMLAQLAAGTLIVPGYAQTADQTAIVLNTVPNVWTWWPDIGFGNGETIPG